MTCFAVFLRPLAVATAKDAVRALERLGARRPEGTRPPPALQEVEETCEHWGSHVSFPLSQRPRSKVLVELQVELLQGQSAKAKQGLHCV